jgi:hypothetical protein
MIGLLRADLLRLRGRREVGLVIAGIMLIHVIVFLHAFSIAKADADLATSVPPPPTGVEEFLKSQEEYRAAALAGFAVPASVSSMMRPGFPVLLVGLAFLAALTMGSDFDWGTVRSGILLAGSRRRFILVRHVTIWAVVAVAIAGLAVLALIAPQILSATGAPVGWTGQSLLPALAPIALTAFQAAVYASIALAITSSHVRLLAGSSVRRSCSLRIAWQASRSAPLSRPSRISRSPAVSATWPIPTAPPSPSCP